MSTENGILRGVSWRDCCPWLLLIQSVRLAPSIHLVLLSLVGVISVSLGWRLAGALFLPQETKQAESTINVTHLRLARWPGGRGPVAGLAKLTGLPGATRAPFDPVTDVPYRFIEPFRRVLRPGTSWNELGYFLTGGLWSLAVWALFGGAITRSAIVRLGLDQRVGIREALRFARAKWTSFVAAPALPLVGISLVALPMLVLGWIMRLNAGVVLAGLVWLPVLVGGLLMAILAIGLLFGWPLMWGTISAESSDAFDAISRSYAYTFQRPLHYLFYAFVAALLGALGWLLLWWFTEGIIMLSHWGVSWGAGAARLDDIAMVIDRGETTSGAISATSTSLWLGASLMVLGEGLVRSVASATAYSYFWCVTAAIYLLLRQDTDQTEMDDVVVKEEEEGLPPLETDEAGVPAVSHEPPPDSDAPGVDS